MLRLKRQPIVVYLVSPGEVSQVRYQAPSPVHLALMMTRSTPDAQSLYTGIDVGAQRGLPEQSGQTRLSAVLRNHKGYVVLLLYLLDSRQRSYSRLTVVGYRPLARVLL